MLPGNSKSTCANLFPYSEKLMSPLWLGVSYQDPNHRVKSVKYFSNQDYLQNTKSKVCSVGKQLDNANIETGLITPTSSQKQQHIGSLSSEDRGDLQ